MTATAGVLLVGLLAGAPAAMAATTGAVGGVRDPANGTLELTVQAAENEGAGLRSASVSLGDEVLDTGPFADPGCGPGTCPEVGSVALQAPTTGVADGPQRLVVTVEDGAGRVTAIVDRIVMVANAQPTYTSSVTLTIGSHPTTGPSGGTPPPPGGIGGESSSCRAPRLAVTLASRPARIRRGLPLLVPGRRHRFTGRLTCHDGTRRVAAPRGTPIGVRHWIRGRVARQQTLRTGANGRFSARIRVTSRRVLAFRARSASDKVIRVRIHLGVVR